MWVIQRHEQTYRTDWEANSQRNKEHYKHIRAHAHRPARYSAHKNTHINTGKREMRSAVKNLCQLPTELSNPRLRKYISCIPTALFEVCHIKTRPNLPNRLGNEIAAQQGILHTHTHTHTRSSTQIRGSARCVPWLKICISCVPSCQTHD